MLDRLRQTFELHGFASIETRAVEPLDRLAKQGEIDKEVYAVQRLHAEPGAAAELGLHFDLTVPFARYVLENAHQLAFPFRRYQIQKVWRGERPQEGRYREFTQADIDIVDADRLAAHHDVELPLVTLEALERLHVDLGLPPVLMRVNNRRLAQGFYLGLGIADPAAVLRQVDKIDKIGPDQVPTLLVDEVGVDRGSGAGLRPAGRDLGRRRVLRRPGPRARRRACRSSTQGLELLADAGATPRPATCPAGWSPTCKIARGLDYYTGTVYETELVGFESLGLDLLRRPLRLAGQRRPDHATPGSACRSASPGCWRRCSAAGLLRRLPAGADRGAGRGRRGGDPGRGRRGGRAAAGPRASPARWRRRPTSSASRSATPTAAASRTSGSAGWPTARSRTCAAASRCRPTPGVWPPPEADLVPQVLSQES